MQEAFNKFTKKYNLSFDKSSLILDGGNYVDNYHGRTIVSDRFLKDNGIPYLAAKKKLKELLHLNEVTIIPFDDPK